MLFLEENMEVIAVIAVVSSLLAIIALFMTIRLSSRMKKFQKAYTSLQTFLSGMRMEDILKANLKEVRELSQEVSSQAYRLHQVEGKLRNAIDRAELIRFNSFDNMGAELSFALALLNQEGTGIILTSIQSIEDCRVYAKKVEKGQTAAKLNPEEKQAIEKACRTIKV